MPARALHHVLGALRGPLRRVKPVISLQKVPGSLRRSVEATLTQFRNVETAGLVLAAPGHDGDANTSLCLVNCPSPGSNERQSPIPVAGMVSAKGDLRLSCHPEQGGTLGDSSLLCLCNLALFTRNNVRPTGGTLNHWS